MYALTQEQIELIGGMGDNVYKNIGKQIGKSIGGAYYGAVDGLASVFEWLDSKWGDPVNLTD